MNKSSELAPGIRRRVLPEDQVATFAISRFRRIEPTGSSFTLPVDFDPRAYANNAFGVTG